MARSRWADHILEVAFFVLGFGSMFAYALQNTLLVRFARSMDGLSLSFYRNASFIVTLSPLLFMATRHDLLAFRFQWPLLLVSAVAGAVAQTLSFAALRRLSVGVTSAFTASCSSTLTVFMSSLFLGDEVRGPIVTCIAITSLGCLLLGLQRMSHREQKTATIGGFLLCLFASVFFVTTRIVLASVSRTANPLVTTYVWEVSFAGASGVLLIIRRAAGGKGIQRVTGTDFARIALFALPTLFGTGLFSLAARTGPLPVLSTISTLSLVTVAFLARVFYGEKLSHGQWLSMGVIFGGIVAIKLY